MGRPKDIKLPRDIAGDINWKPLTKYFKVLLWAPYDNTKPGVSFMELVVDYEVATGLSIIDPKKGNNTTWKQKEHRLKRFYKYICKAHPEYDAPLPSRSMTHFTIFGGHLFQGLSRRPVFLAKKATEEAIVKNITDFYATARNTLTIQVHHILSYQGVRFKHLTLDSDVLLLRRQMEDYQEAIKNSNLIRRRIRGKSRPVRALVISR